MIVAVEGPSYAGKTSIIAELRRRPVVEAALTFGCYVASIPHQRVPVTDPGSTEGQVAAFEVFMEIESLRATQAAARRESTGEEVLVLLDRSVDTLLAHARALDSMRGYDCEPHLREALTTLPHLVPDLTLYLDVPAGELAARRGRYDDYLLHDTDFLRHTRDYFLATGTNLRTAKLEVFDGLQAPSALAEAMTASIERNRP